jgi:hypothetical protein
MKTHAILALSVVALAIIAIAGCGSSNNSASVKQASMAVVNLSLSDPATCSAPQGSFAHIYVTITDVQINASSTAGDNDSSWIDLTPSLKNSPQQVDLLGLATNQCFLAMLGDNAQLQQGTYQQIRVILADNSATVANNNCKSAGANCVVLASSPSTPQTLQLSSESKTGIKIPSGQLAGGQFTIAAGQTKDLNIDFNACASIVQEGNGKFRLKPVLHAGEVSTTSVSINGTVVDSETHQPLVGGAVLVALEQKDPNVTTSPGVDRIIMETKADPTTGAFVFCPVPAGSYDVIAVGVNGAGTSYAATAALAVSPGSALGNVPLVAVSIENPAQATITGLVTTANLTPAATAADVVVSAEQQVSSSLLVIIPLVQQLSSSLTVTTQSPASSTGTACPTNTACANYNLGIPAANPNVGTFSASGTSYSQAGGTVAYTVAAQAFVPGGAADCNPSSLSVNTDSTNSPLTVTAGATSTAATITFMGCQ